MNINITILLLILIACQSKKKENQDLSEYDKKSIDNLSQNNSLIIKLEHNTLYFKDIATTKNTENVNSDYIISTLEKHKVLIKGSFLESDLLDGKDVVFLKGDISNIKIKFKYDLVFTGNEKRTINLGLSLDTLINLKIYNKRIEIPKFDDIKQSIWKKIQKDNSFNKVYSIGLKYVNQNESEEVYLSYLNKIEEFKKDKMNLRKLQELLIDIDYTEFEIEFLEDNNIVNKVIYDRGFIKNNDLKLNDEVALNSLKSQLDNYKIAKEIKCDLNKDDREDLVIIFEPQNNQKVNDEISHIIDSPFCIMINQGNGKYSKFVNKKIIYTSKFNCPDFVLEKFEVKDNYIIIQQTTCDDFDRIIKDNVTFKYNIHTNEIILDKYKRSLFERLDKSEFLPLSKTLSSKNFGKILFENYDSKIEYDEIYSN